MWEDAGSTFAASFSDDACTFSDDACTFSLRIGVPTVSG
jgi:hypothetical protein